MSSPTGSTGPRTRLVATCSVRFVATKDVDPRLDVVFESKRCVAWEWKRCALPDARTANVVVLWWEIWERHSRRYCDCDLVPPMERRHVVVVW